MRILLSFVMIMLGVIATPPAAAQGGSPSTLTVVTKEIEPFVFFEEGQPAGFSIELWEMIALEAGLQYEWRFVETVSEQLTAVQNGEADAAIAAISMTAEREEVVDFSYPYFDSGLQIMTPLDATALPSTLLDVLLSRRVLLAIGALFLSIFIIANIVWLVERQENEDDFPGGYLQGIWEAIWWASVTVTTVGYGDKTPRAFWGRVIGLIWMFIGLFVIANFTAAITAQITISELRSSIQDPSELNTRRIATVSDTTSAEWLARNRLSFRGVESIEEAYTLLENDAIDAIVFDAPVLLYHAANEGRGKFTLVGDTFDLETYGIAMPNNSPHAEAINTAILKIIEDGRYDDLHHAWFATTRFE